MIVKSEHIKNRCKSTAV